VRDSPATRHGQYQCPRSASSALARLWRLKHHGLRAEFQLIRRDGFHLLLGFFALVILSLLFDRGMLFSFRFALGGHVCLALHQDLVLLCVFGRHKLKAEWVERVVEE
jgi:hypothetical protein